ncbi:MAG: alpha/beta hydrolase family protein [Hyphomicrobiales bacterium]
MTQFIFYGPNNASPTLLLTHGEAVGIDGHTMALVSEGIAEAGIRVALFEFDYMREMNTSGKVQKTPDIKHLCQEFRNAMHALDDAQKLFMGGRIATLIGGELFAEGFIHGIVCLGYPFHPPGNQEELRTAHLYNMKAPTLICQGSLDQFGTSDEIAEYKLPSSISFRWLEDSDHSFMPLKSSVFSYLEHIETVISEITTFMHEA